MFKNKKVKAYKDFQKAVEEYAAFLNSVVEMGYGKYTKKQLMEKGREDLVLKEDTLREKLVKAMKNI